MRLFITPSDVWLFRGGLPFTAGETPYIQSLFPPSPETVQGALRALIASRWDGNLARAFARRELTELIGDRRGVGRFRLGVVTIGRRMNGSVVRLFPAPAHLIARHTEGASASPPALVRPAEPAQVATMTNLPEGLLPLYPPASATGAGRLEPFDRWLTEAELAACLAGDVAGTEGTPSSAIFQYEPRTGIGLRPDRRTTEEGRLYTIEMVRMLAGWGLVADVTLAPPADAGRSAPGAPAVSSAREICALLRLPPRGWLSIGAEQRAATYEVLDDPPAGAPAPPSAHAGRPLVYLATPASFACGWRPADWGVTFGAAPVGAAVPRAQLIGGWRLSPGSAHGEAKALRRCVPAGSVYFFEQPLATRGPYTEYGGEIGYGQAIQGVW